VPVQPTVSLQVVSDGFVFGTTLTAEVDRVTQAADDVADGTYFGTVVHKIVTVAASVKKPVGYVTYM